MRPTIKPTAVERMETEKIDYYLSDTPRARFYDWQNPEEVSEARTGRWLFSIEANSDKRYFNENRLIGLKIVESLFGQPRFILEN